MEQFVSYFLTQNLNYKKETSSMVLKLSFELRRHYHSFLQFATRTRDWIVSIYEINRKHWYHPGWNDSVSLAGMFRPEVHWLKGSHLLA